MSVNIQPINDVPNKTLAEPTRPHCGTGAIFPGLMSAAHCSDQLISHTEAADKLTVL
jgi:hypothetical protein